MLSEASSSDSDDLIEGSWSLNKRRKITKKTTSEHLKTDVIGKIENKLHFQEKKFEELKSKSSEILSNSLKRRQKTELRRSQKLLKKALKDPHIKALVDGETSDRQKEDILEWKDVKPYLNINSHLTGPISHGDCGPKTELEYKIEDAINEGDIEKAELLSDTLADREFASKIAHAFDAKKCDEEMKKQKLEEKIKQLKKLRWTFEAKKKWQMKGNM